MFIPGCGCCGGCLAGLCCCAPCTQPPSEITIEIIPGTPAPGPTLPMIKNTGSTSFSYTFDLQAEKKMAWSDDISLPGWGTASNTSWATSQWKLGGLLWKYLDPNPSVNWGSLSADGVAVETRTMTIPWSVDSNGVMDSASIAVANNFLTVKRVLALDNSQRTYPLGHSDAPIKIGNPQWGYSNDFIGATGIPSTADATITCDQLAGNLAYANQSYLLSAYFSQQYSIGLTTPNLLYQQKFYDPVQRISDVVSNVTAGGVPTYPVGMKNLMGCAPAVTGSIPLYNGIRVYVSYTRWTLSQYRVDVKTTPSPSPKHAQGFFVGTPYRMPPTPSYLSGESPANAAALANMQNAVFGSREIGGSLAGYSSSPYEQDPAFAGGVTRLKYSYLQAWVEYYKSARDAFVDAGDWAKYYVYTEIFPDTQIGYIDFPDASFKVTAGRAEGAATPTSGRCGCVPVLPDTVDVTLSATGLTQIDGPTISIPQSFIDALNKAITMTRRNDRVIPSNGQDVVAFYSVGPIDGPAVANGPTSDCPWDGTYWATLEIKCNSARIHLGLNAPYADGWSDTKGGTEIQSDGYYIGGIDFSGSIGASVNAICSGASTTFEFTPVDATVFAADYSAFPPSNQIATFSVSGINIVVTFPPLWKPNAAWTAAAFSGGGTAPSHFVKASLTIAGYTGVRPTITARRAGVVHITADSVSQDCIFQIFRNATSVYSYGVPDCNNAGDNAPAALSTTFSVSAGDVITLGDPTDFHNITNIAIWWTAT